MDIAGPAFVWGITAVTAVVLLIAIFILPRHRGPGIGKYLTQAIALIVSVLLCISTIGAWLNKENQWFTSWQEIVSPETAQDASTQDYGAKETKASATVPAVEQVATAVQKNPASNSFFGSQLLQDDSKGQYIKFDVPGSVSGKTMSVTAWLPPGYMSNPDKFYPVIMGFPGFPGSPDTYQNTIDYGALLRDKNTSGNLANTILIVPDVYPGNYDSECVDASGDNTPHTETFVTQDLVPWIKTNLRVIDSKDAWATTGYSAGGWCASMFTVKHPDIFSAALVQAGYFEPIYSDNQKWLDDQDPNYMLPDIVSRTKPDVGIFFYTSDDDDLPKDTLPAFRKAVQAPTELTISTVPTGGHRVEVWVPGINLGLDWLAQRSGYFAK